MGTELSGLDNIPKKVPVSSEMVFKLNFNSGRNFMRTFVFSKNLFEKHWPGYLPNLLGHFM